jgi:hypothetical protein
MITAWNGHRNYVHLSASVHPGDEHPPAVVENDLLAGFFCQPSTLDSESRLEKNSFLMEQYGDVIENKGRLWKTWG